MQPIASQFTQQLETLKVLIVDDEATMRKVTRSLLQVIGVKTIEVMRSAGATCLALDARRCLLLDGDEVRRAANNAKISIFVD